MNELKNFGINPITGKEIKWNLLERTRINRYDTYYNAYTYQSEVVKIITTEDLFKVFNTDVRNWETTFFDEIVMPSLTLAQQERIVESYRVNRHLYNTPKKIRQILTPVRHYDFIKNSLMATHPLTGEVLNTVVSLHGGCASVCCPNKNGTYDNHHFFTGSDIEEAKKIVGNNLGIAIRYVDVVKEKEE